MKSNAINKAYKKYHKELYFYALSLCRDESVAKELVSEAFYKALISSNASEGPFKYWLFRVLKNHYIDVKRKESKTRSIDYYEDTLHDQPEQGPASQQLQKERDTRLYGHLVELEPKA